MAQTKISLQQIYQPSEDVIAREIEGEMILIPLTASIADMEDELYTLNESGREIWQRLNGITTLAEIAHALADGYQAPLDEIEEDILGLLKELMERKMVVAK